MLLTDVQNAFRVFDLPITANESVVNTRYRKLALSIHPDKNKDPQAEEQFKNLQKAKAEVTKYYRGPGIARSLAFDDEMVQRISQSITHIFIRQLGIENPSSLADQKQLLEDKQHKLQDFVNKELTGLTEQFEKAYLTLQDEYKPVMEEIAKCEDDYHSFVSKASETKRNIEKFFSNELQRSQAAIQEMNERLDPSSSDFFTINPIAYVNFKQIYQEKIDQIDQELEKITLIYENQKKTYDEQYAAFISAKAELKNRKAIVIQSVIGFYDKTYDQLKTEENREKNEHPQRPSTGNSQAESSQQIDLKKEEVIAAFKKKFLNGKTNESNDFLWSEELELDDHARSSKYMTIFFCLLCVSMIGIFAKYLRKSVKNDAQKINSDIFVESQHFFDTISKTQILPHNVTVKIHQLPKLMSQHKHKSEINYLLIMGIISVIGACLSFYSKRQKGEMISLFAIGILSLIAERIRCYLKKDQVALPSETSFQ